jgi:glyoxylase-like metal-dependent hydrolase (beta-lactamase superfamily II)
MQIQFFEVGFTSAPEAIILPGGSWQRLRIPALCACIDHPRLGLILVDTGYSHRFFSATRQLPYRMFRLLTPVQLATGQDLASQLHRQGIRAEAVDHIIITHFHADHLGGVADFPKARFTFMTEAYQAVQGKRGLAALRAGYLPGHLPRNFESRAQMIDNDRFVPLPSGFAPFDQGVDLFGDGSIWGVSLPGHALGQMGLIVQTSNLGTLFLAADACWHSRSYRELIFPHRLTNLLHPDPAAYRATILKLHQLHCRMPDLPIIPSHCPEAATTYVPLSGGQTA